MGVRSARPDCARTQPLQAVGFALGRHLLGKGTREVRPIYTFLLVALLMAPCGRAQTAPAAAPAQKPAEDENTSIFNDLPSTEGPTAFVQVEGNHHNMGDVLTYDFNVGYKINSHTSADFGAPLYSTRTPFSVISKADWRDTTIIGAPYIDVRYDTKYKHINVTSILTGSAGFNMVKTYSDGRFMVDWFNHFDRNYQLLNYDVLVTPFLNLGAGTGSVDRQIMPRPYELARPYETLGNLGNGEVGLAFTFKKVYRLEASAYGLAPEGPQKIYSRLVSPDNLLGGDGHHNRFWDALFETSGYYYQIYEGLPTYYYQQGAGPSWLSRDNGEGAYLTVTTFKRAKNLSLQLGYTKSVRYDYGSAFIMLRYNFTGLLRNLTIGE